MSYGCSETGDASGFRGCGRLFGGLRDFDHHWVKVTSDYDESRDRSTVDIGGRRCATSVELRDLGMIRNYRGVWQDAAVIAAAITRFRVKGLTESHRG